jgi:hypothetical protein
MSRTARRSEVNVRDAPLRRAPSPLLRVRKGGGNLSAGASLTYSNRAYASSTASAPFTASALSVTVFSSEVACTAMFSAKNRASAT